ncbi:DUF7507 domain-containing protein, partial [Algoriphagus namhaensis]
MTWLLLIGFFVLPLTVFGQTGTVTVDASQNNVPIVSMKVQVGSNAVQNVTFPTQFDNQQTAQPAIIKEVVINTGSGTRTLFATSRRPTAVSANSKLGNNTNNTQVRVINFDDANLAAQTPHTPIGPFLSDLGNAVSIPDLRSYWSIDGTDIIAPGQPFVKLIYPNEIPESGYILVTERFGNSSFDLVALDKNGNVIPGARKVQIRGYQWNTGIHHQFDNTSQPQHLLVFSPSIFEQNPANPVLPPIYGFQVNDQQQADGKFVFFSNQISAAPDNAGPIFSFIGAPNALNIYANDEINGQVLTNPAGQVSTQVFDINNVLSTNGGPLQLNVVTGQVSVPPGTPEGIYVFEYEITDLVDGGKDRTTVTVRVVNNTDPEFPECDPDNFNCTTNNLNITQLYLSDAFGNPISNKTCDVGTSQDVYVSIKIQQNSNTSRYEARLFADLIIGGNTNNPIKVNSFLGDINEGANGIVTRVLTDSFLWNCGDELRLEGGLIVWLTKKPKPGEEPDDCGDYNKAQSECLPSIFIASPLSIDYSFLACTSSTDSGSSTLVNFTSIPNGGVRPYSYAWDFDNNGTTDSTVPNPSFTFTAGSSAQVKLTLRDSDNPVSSTSITKTIVFPDAIDATASTSAVTSAGNDGAIDITAVGGSGNFTYSWTGPNGFTSASEDISGLSGGAYTVTITDAANTSCSVQKTFTLCDFIAAPTVLDQVVCEAQGSLNYNVTTGTGLQAVWYSTETSTDGTFTAPSVDTSTPGTYSVWVSQAQVLEGAVTCESQRVEVEIKVDQKPMMPTLEVINPTCTVDTGEISFATAQGVEYSLTNTFANVLIPANGIITVSGLAAGSSGTVFARTVNTTCVVSANFSIGNQPATPSAPAATPTQPTCEVATGSIVVTAITDGMYSIDNGATFQSSNTFSNLAAGTYQVKVKNAAGCISPATATVINPQPATPSAPEATPTQPTCEVATGSIVVTAITDGMYSIDNGATFQSSNTFTNLVAGTYQVKVKNVAGCISPATATVINPQPATPSAPEATPTQPTCEVATGSIVVTAITDGMYSIDNGATFQSSNTFSNLAAGTYQVKVKNAAGCISPATATVINPQPATPSAPEATPTQPTCEVATGSIVVTAITNGMYSIDNGATFQSSNTFTNLVAGTYQVKVKNAAGCISAATATVINPQPATSPVPTVSNRTICKENSGTIGYNVTALQGYTITYYSSATSMDGTTTAPTVSRSIAGTSSVWVTQSKAGECESARVQVSVAVVDCLKDLLLTSFCSDDPTQTRRWRIRNTNNFAVTVNWTLNNGGAQNGTFVIPANDELFFNTNTESGANTMIISWVNEAGQTKTATKASCPDRCIATPTYTAVCTNDPSAERVYSISNPNSFAVNVTWAGVGGSGTGSITLPAGTTADYVLATTANEVEFTLPSVCGNVKRDTIASSSQECPKPSIELVKEGEIIIEGSTDCPFDGDKIRYTFTVYNRGNVPLTSVTLSDPLFESPNPMLSFGDPSGDVGEDGVLGTSEVWVYTVDYTITQLDIEAGRVVNQATVTSLFNQEVVSDLSGTFNDAVPGENNDKTVVEICQAPSLSILKVVDIGQISAPTLLAYTITISNTGNIDLTGVDVSDELPNGSAAVLGTPTGDTTEPGVLNVGETWVYTVTY